LINEQFFHPFWKSLKETDDTSKKHHSTCRLCFIWAATTTIAGIGLLVFDLMPLLQQFGRITALTILYSFISSVFILFSILAIWDNKKKRN